MKLKGLLLLIFILIVLVIAGFIGAQNDHLVTINYLINDVQQAETMSTVLATSFISGFLFCFILFLFYVLRLKWKINHLSRKNKKLLTSSEQSQ